jgi:hypothetical protein
MDSLNRWKGRGFVNISHKFARITILSTLSACLLTGCAATSQIHDYCQIAKPIYLQKGEAAKLSDATARQILAANETWAKVCK